MDTPDLRPALELTAAMNAAADDDWPTVAELAGRRRDRAPAGHAGGRPGTGRTRRRRMQDAYAAQAAGV
jgi:hypothetical protein